jgi:hypothetical protein
LDSCCHLSCFNHLIRRRTNQLVQMIQLDVNTLNISHMKNTWSCHNNTYSCYTHEYIELLHTRIHRVVTHTNT